MPRLSCLPLAFCAGATYGLALARFLFEQNPQAWAWCDTWLGAGFCGILGGCLGLGVCAALQRRVADLGGGAALVWVLPLLSLLAPEVNLLRAQTLLLAAPALFALVILQNRLPHWAWPLMLFLGLLALYGRGLAPAVGEADTFEFQVGIARLGIAHGSGYPLLMVVGKVFSLLPLGGTLAWRANLTSAFFGALAAVGVERLARHLGARPLPAFFAGLVFGLSPTLWSRAVEVEVYTLNAALVVGILWLGVRMLSNVQRATSKVADIQFPISSHQSPISRLQSLVSRPQFLCFLLGLSLTNHLTTLLLFPACAFALAWPFIQQLRITHYAFSRPNLQPLVSCLLFFLLGLSLYLYIPLRWPAVNNGEWLSLERFVNILTGNEAKGAFQWWLPFSDKGRYAIVGRKILEEYGAFGLALVACGLLFQVSNWPTLVFFALAYAPYVYFALAFNVPDPDFSAFFIPLHLIAAIGIGLGLHALSQWPQRLIRLPRDLFFIFASLLPLTSLWVTFPRVDQSNDWAQLRLGEYILSYPLAQGATILADSQKIAPLYYLQVAEGARPDLDIIVLPDEASYRAVLDDRMAQGQTVYLARYLPGLGSGYSLRSVGPLAQVSATPWASPATTITTPLAAALAEGIRLIGFNQENTRITAFWQAASMPAHNLLVNWRLRDATGAAVWRSAGNVPVSNLYPTNAWRPGEIVSDFYDLAPAVPPGQYAVEVGFFAPFAADEAGAWTRVTTLDVTAPLDQALWPGAVQRRAVFGPHVLLGYDAPQNVTPNARFTLRTYWQATAEPLTLFGQTYSLAAWPPGTVAPLAISLTAPDVVGPWPLNLSTGAPAQCGWLQPMTETCALTTLQVSGEAIGAGAFNFGNLLWLRQAQIETPRAAPGGQVRVTLDWQAQQAIADDYTVFVHLIGPDGLVHGQVDAWPQMGTLATSRWQPGQRLSDPYLIAIPTDAPPGPYQVEVGLYLLATLERLPVLNIEGIPVEDKVLVGGVVIK